MNNKQKTEVPEDFMRDEYDFDYTKGVRGKYARKTTEENGYIKLTPDTQKIFQTSEEVNNALRAFIAAIPKTRKKAVRIV